MLFVRRRATVAVVACLVLPAVARAGVKIIGETPAPRPAASCPANCQAIGQVTGFQVQQGTRKNPYRATRDGKIVGFSITLGKPSDEQTRFFTRLFGGPPEARISVLRPAKLKRRHRLTGQSEVFELEPYFGSRPTFALRRPLTVKKGYVIALTVPTWIPAFSVGLAKDEAWRSSRDPAHCDDVQQAAAQETRGTIRRYACFYRTARLLYTAVVITTPKPTNRD
jgi:hypothetical protein